MNRTAEPIRNLTAQEAYDAWLDTATLGEFIEQGNMILLWCRTCGYDGGQSARLDLDGLVALPPDMTLRALATRATFKCGHRGAWVDSRRDPKRMPKPPEPA